MELQFNHSFTNRLQPFYNYLIDEFDFLEGFSYDGSTLKIQINDNAEAEEQSAINEAVNSRISNDLDLSDYNAKYLLSPECVIISTGAKRENLLPFDRKMKEDFPKFKGLGYGKGFLRIFVDALTLQEEIDIFNCCFDFLSDSISLDSHRLKLDIKKGIFLRKEAGLDFVDNIYVDIMLSVANSTSSETMAALIESTFKEALDYVKSGYFVNAYNSIEGVVPANVTADPTAQAVLTQLRAENMAAVLDLCYQYYTQEVLDNTPSIPPQNP